MTGQSTRQRPRRRWVWVLVALVTATAFAVPFRLRIFVPNGSNHHELASPVSYRRDISALAVAANAGAAVTVRAGRPGEVTVTSSLSWLFSKPAVTQSWQGGTLHVGATCPKLAAFGDCQASITIVIPAGTPVQGQVGAGSMSVTGLRGPLHLSATSGLLTARNISGPVWATVTTGDLTARTGLTSDHFSASAAAGVLILAFATRPERLSIGVGAGSAMITLPPGSRYHVVSSSGRGAVSVAPGLSDATSGQVISVSVGAGEATIGYPLVAG